MRRTHYAGALLAVGVLRTALLAVQASALAGHRDAEALVAVRIFMFLEAILLWSGLVFLFLAAFPRFRVLGWVGFGLSAAAELFLLVPLSMEGGSALVGAASIAALAGALAVAVRQTRQAATR